VSLVSATILSRKRSLVRFVLVPALLAACTSCLASAGVPAPSKESPPKIMLWSWFGADDFRGLANRDIGVAYLALSLEFEGQRVVPSPRLQPVRVPREAYPMAVVRFNFDTYANTAVAFTGAQRALAVRMIAEIVNLARPRALQVDFDAPRSAWPFYRQLLHDVRQRIGPDVFLSITALVSWCDREQSWMTGLPVDEIVPMAFYMGQATPAIAAMLARGGQFAFPACRGSIGVEVPFSAQAPLNTSFAPELIRPHPNQRAYFFASPRRWSSATVARANEAFLP